MSDTWTFHGTNGERSLCSPGSEETNVENVTTVVERSDAGLLMGSSATASQLATTFRVESTVTVDPLESQVSVTDFSLSPEQIRGAIDTNIAKQQ